MDLEGSFKIFESSLRMISEGEFIDGLIRIFLESLLEGDEGVGGVVGVIFSGEEAEDESPDLESMMTMDEGRFGLTDAFPTDFPPVLWRGWGRLLLLLLCLHVLL